MAATFLKTPKAYHKTTWGKRAKVFEGSRTFRFITFWLIKWHFMLLLVAGLYGGSLFYAAENNDAWAAGYQNGAQIFLVGWCIIQVLLRIEKRLKRLGSAR
jgi:hypothetical protein